MQWTTVVVMDESDLGTAIAMRNTKMATDLEILRTGSS
jgi:hypothetical protein